MCERRFTRNLQNRQTAKGCAALHCGPVLGLHAHIFKIDAGQMQRDSEFLATTSGEIEVDQALCA